MSLLKIAGGTLYDPANGVEGVVCDLWIQDGRVISPPEQETRADRVIDAHGLVVMPGGVDMHCHIAGPKVNAARMLQPESNRSRTISKRGEFRSGTLGSVPSTFATGYLYAGLGYTSAFDAAVPPLMARHAHEEFEDTPILDKGFYVMLGNHQYLLRQLGKGEEERARHFIGWIVGAAKAYGVKIVNPGGVETWKQSGGNIRSLDDVVPHFGVTPRQVLRGIARCVDDLGIPHPVHLHCNNLGLPGNWTTTLETMKALEGHRGHITHIQFHSYGGSNGDQSTFCSKVPELVDYVRSHPNLSVDVGQVLFGQTTSMTGDGPLGYYLHRVLGSKWLSCDVEVEAGCGVSPITYKNKSLIHALQWAIGLEWYLLMDDPWRIAMSTDHPNGGAFLAYPQIIALLMSRNLRDELLQTLPAEVRNFCSLPEIDREYSLHEIAIITRAAPARILGLTQKGHLGPGADGDVTLYQPHVDRQRMFELPRYLIHRGTVVLDDGELRSQQPGTVFYVLPDYDQGVLPDVQNWFNSQYSLRFANYAIDESALRNHLKINCSTSAPPCVVDNPRC